MTNRLKRIDDRVALVKEFYNQFYKQYNFGKSEMRKLVDNLWRARHKTDFSKRLSYNKQYVILSELSAMSESVILMFLRTFGIRSPEKIAPPDEKETK